jgi:DnaK suppressor protein
MNLRRAQDLIDAERDRILQLLAGSASARAEDLEAAADAETSVFDRASPLAQELLDDVVAEQLRSRLAALQRANERLAAGTYGFSLHSGLPIPDERLEADPAAECLVEEAASKSRAGVTERHVAS